MRIRLNAGDKLVGYFDVLPFVKLPEVMVWGSRTFRVRETARVTDIKIKDGHFTATVELTPVTPPPLDDCHAIYDEACAFVISAEPVREED